MSKGSDISDEMDKIKREIEELEKKGGVGWHGQGDNWPGDKLTDVEQEKLEKLHVRLEKLKKEDK